MAVQYSPSQIPEPEISKFLFADAKLSWLWLILRVYAGWQWIMAGLEKFQNPAWIGPKAGGAISGFVMGALKKTAGDHPDVPSWYGYFLQHSVIPNSALFSYLITLGELAVGIALVLGLFTGIAAFFGAFMNMNYLFSGAVSINPLLFLIQLFIILAWRVAGYLGLDKFVLPLLGTPWKPGKLFKKR